MFSLHYGSRRIYNYSWECSMVKKTVHGPNRDIGAEKEEMQVAI